jgi:SAM-dependent methyltransferase
MADDAERALNDFDQMADAYADDAAVDPVKTAYDRPAILSMVGEIEGRRVLDVGCAAGVLSELLVERGAEVVGIDLNPRLIELATERLAGSATFLVADITQALPFESGTFDVVCASLVLHYVRDWGPPLRELARVLRPNGVLAMSTHHPAHDLEIADAADQPASYFETVLLTDTWRKSGRDVKVRFYHRPLSVIVESIADAGFLIERMPEPVPDRASFPDRMDELYARMMKQPWFLFIRARRGPRSRLGD